MSLDAVNIGLGWIPLVQVAALELAEYPADWNARIEEVGTDNGALALVVLFDDPMAVDCIDGLCDRYRARSLMVCEECGAPARLRLGVYAVATLCEDHADYAAPFLPEDS